MKEAIKLFVKDRQECGNGLFLIDMPTGSGKTYNTIEIITEFIKDQWENEIDKIFYITPLIKNCDDVIKKLYDNFKDNELELLENSILKIPANYECVLENLEGLESSIPSYIKNSKSYKTLIQSVKFYNKFKPEYNNSNILNETINQIRLSYEPDFRAYLKKEIYKNTDNERERKEKLNTEDFSWVKKLYPSSLVKDRKVIFMTVSKFINSNDPIISKSFRFVSNSIIDNSLVFIDEFDSANNAIQNQFIEESCDNKIDLYNAFFSVASSLRSRQFEKSLFANSIDLGNNKSSLVSFEKMRDVVLNAYNEFNLMYSFKLEKEKEKEHYFLFDDFSLHTITNGNKRNIYVETSEEKNQNLIKLYNDEQNTLSQSFFATISTIKGAMTYFINCCAMLSRNYMENYNNIARINKKEFIEIEQAASTILDPFNFDTKTSATLLKIIINNFARNNRIKKIDTLETDFYSNGFKYYDFIDDLSHDTSTKISMCYLDNTAEAFLLTLAKRTLVVGLSATGTIDNVTGNFNIKYLEERLGDGYYHLSKAEKIRIDTEVRNRIKRNNTITVHTMIANDNDEILLSKSLCRNNDYAQEIATLMTSSIKEIDKPENMYFYSKKFTRILLAIKDFILNEKSRALLILATRNLNDQKLYSLSSLKTAIAAIIKDSGKKLNIPCIHELSGRNFNEIKEKYKNDLKEGKKVILCSSYPSVGSGQNLQYFLDEEENSKEYDVDSLYLEHPTNILVKLDDKSTENDLVKYIYQMESLRARGDITPYLANENIQSAFKTFMLSTIKKFKNIRETYECISINNNKLTRLIQGTGRICRTKDEYKDDVNIYVDQEIFEKVDFSILKDGSRVLNPEFEKIVETSALFTNKNEKDRLYNQILDKNERIEKQINNILNINHSTWNDSSMEQWKIFRDITLKYPTISRARLNELCGIYGMNSIREWYADFGEEKRVRYKYLINDKNELVLDNLYNKDYIEISQEKSRLSDIMRINQVKNVFLENQYATEFEPNEMIILPVVYQNIYKGALGEVAGKTILEYNKISLKEITDNKKFEKFDFCLSSDEDSYIDFKNWSDSTEMNLEYEINKAKEKLNNINGKRAIIINIYSNDKRIIKQFDNILTVSSLFTINKNKVEYITKEEIKRIVKFILGE